MKITPIMLEAGVAAMARIKRTTPTDAATVNYVFSAMYAAMEMEKQRERNTWKEPAYAHQDWPAWRYGPNGQSQIFANPDEVPEGWASVPGELPRSVETIKKRPGRPRKEQAHGATAEP